ncbi:thioredoxin domain-containing protein [Sphingobium sp. AP50]|uniref:thioredoxin domain-containing protein n=1 Tax=Sphingobium sp. AP50 TaxID=1884369 RepID=UPI002739A122|nr:thioredoxin domain-containing protein [Sphingobium sp. AP50]
MATTPNDILIVICPVCATAHRLPRQRLAAGGTCGRCPRPLFAGEPVILTTANFDAHASWSDISLLADFWAIWCSPCGQMAPAFNAAAGQLDPTCGWRNPTSRRIRRSRVAMPSGPIAKREVHTAVDIAKCGLGDRGCVWWTDGAAYYNRPLARNTPYADWCRF